MESSRVNNLTAFLPAKDFDLCCKFYEDLGFKKNVSIKDANRYHQQILVADGNAIDFYKSAGFVRADKTEPMWVYGESDH